MKKYIGWIVVGTLVFYLLSLQVPFLSAVPALCAWAVLGIQWQTLGRGPRNQALLLMITGTCFLFFSAYKGVFLGWAPVFTANVPVLAMFVAVSFLGLTSSDNEADCLPRGKRAVATTAVAIHVLAAIINLSALFVFGDRLQKNGRLATTQLIILGRCFCAAAWWSPFFVATGVALTYAPEMSVHRTLLPGMAMSCIALGFSVVDVCCRKKEEFSGYPFKFESLFIPVSLAVAVIGTHYVRPDIHILNLICVISPVGAVILMKHRPRFESIRSFIAVKISGVSSQFILFLAAGVFSAGIKSLTHVYPALFSLESTSFTPMLFSIILGIIIIVGIAGVHPVVSISIASPLLLPLNVDHSQLGFLFLSSWAIATGSSPLSGMGLALVGRYQASPRVLIESNWYYAVTMWVFASMANMLFFG